LLRTFKNCGCGVSVSPHKRTERKLGVVWIYKSMSEEIIYSNIQTKSLYCCCKNGFVEATGSDNTPGSGVRQLCDILGGTVDLCPESYDPSAGLGTSPC